MKIYISSIEDRQFCKLQDEVTYVSINEFGLLLNSARKEDVFLWEYDYPWNESANRINIDVDTLDDWNEKQKLILSIIKKSKKKVIIFNRSVVDVSTVLHHACNLKKCNDIKLSPKSSQEECLSLYFGLLSMCGEKYWLTLERLEAMSFRPEGIEPFRKNMFISNNGENLTLWFDFISKVTKSRMAFSALENILNERYREISALTLMLENNEKKFKRELQNINEKNNDIIVKKASLKSNAIVLDEKNADLSKKLSERDIVINSLKNEVSILKIDNANYQGEIKKLEEEINRNKLAVSQRFNELAIITGMLEESRDEIEKLTKKLDIADEKYEKIKNSFSWKATAPIRAFHIPVKRKKEKPSVKLNEMIELIRCSEFFDSEWYLLQNPDVMSSGMDPARHYLLFGGFENRNPSLKFSNEMYLELHTDVKEKGINPLEHYILFGAKENRKISY